MCGVSDGLPAMRAELGSDVLNSIAFYAKVCRFFNTVRIIGDHLLLF